MQYKLPILSLILFIIPLIGHADIINVPDDEPTIQDGIDASADGDTVLVQPGTYLETINFNGSEITVASLFLTTGDEDYIEETIIDGNEESSVVIFENSEGPDAKLVGFTITNGSSPVGSGIYCFSVNPSLEHLVVTENSFFSVFGAGDAPYGGGIYCEYAGPIVQNVTVSYNEIGSLDLWTGIEYGSGGGIYLSHSNPTLDNVLFEYNDSKYGAAAYISNTSTPVFTNCYFINHGRQAVSFNESDINISGCTIAYNNGGGLYLDGCDIGFDTENRCSIYDNTNVGFPGTDIEAAGENVYDVYLDTFTFVNPTEEQAYPLENFNFDILNAYLEITEGDLYVSMQGDNGNSGLTEDDPLRDIYIALSIIVPDEVNPPTIHVADGLYSNANGENFPLSLPSHIRISGNSRDNVILDANFDSRIFDLDNIENTQISNLTISQSDGAAIYSTNSTDISIENVSLSQNRTIGFGTGLRCENSTIDLDSVIFKWNFLHDEFPWGAPNGFALYSSDCAISLKNCIIKENGAWLDDLLEIPILGAIYLSGGTAEISNTSIKNHYHSDLVFEELYTLLITDNCTAVLNNIFVQDNTYGILIEDNSDVNIVNSQICSNGEWGIYCIGPDEISIFNSTVSGAGEGGIYADGGLYTIVNSIIWGNSTEEILFNDEEEATLILANSNLEGNWEDLRVNGSYSENVTIHWLDGNIDADPMFVDPENGDYSLEFGSPCIDAGYYAFVWEGDTLMDLEPDDYIGEYPDMGAMEYEPLIDLDVDRNLSEIPGSYGISSIYPNPFNNVTTVTVGLPGESVLQMNVFNILGQRVMTVTNDRFNHGYHTFTIDGTGLSSGVYFVQALINPKKPDLRVKSGHPANRATQIDGDTHNEMRKIVLMK